MALDSKIGASSWRSADHGNRQQLAVRAESLAATSAFQQMRLELHLRDKHAHQVSQYGIDASGAKVRGVLHVWGGLGHAGSTLHALRMLSVYDDKLGPRGRKIQFASVSANGEAALV